MTQGTTTVLDATPPYDDSQPVTSGNGPRYDYSAAAAAEILNLHFDPAQPKAVLYGRILFTILNAMYLAEAELRRAHWEPGEN
jgi:hypothetical protein